MNVRKLFFAAIAALSLGACAQLTAIEGGLSLATKSITNPVTKTDLYKFESGFQVVMTLLQTYKKSCAAGAVDANCKANIAAIQRYTTQIPPYLVQLRAFVKNNDQINAANTYNALVDLYTQAKTTAANLGVNVGG
jgi:hypothetical protein